MKSFLTNTLILIAGLVTMTSPVLVSAKQLETIAEETYNCGTLGRTDGGGLAISFLFNLAPGYFNERATIKHIDNVFKNTDEIVDITGKIIKREEYLEFIINLQKTGIKIEYDKIFEIYKKIDGDIFKLSARQIENVIEYGKHIDNIEIEKIRNVEIIGSVKGLGKEEIINIYELAKQTGRTIDISKVKIYGNNIIKYGDDVFIKNTDGFIKHVDEIEDLTAVNKAVREIEASGYQFPCVVPAVGFNPINILIPVAHANGACVKQIGDNTFDVGGKTIKGTAGEARKIADHLKNGGRFDVDLFHKLKNEQYIVNADHYLDVTKKIDPNTNKFIDNNLEDLYNNYVSKKLSEGKIVRGRAEWNIVRDYWLNDSPMARGNAFNRTALKNRWYPFNEVHLVNGKRVDSYDNVLGEIVSRKSAYLDDMEFSTFDKYLKEMKDKYPVGMEIRSNTNSLIDGQLLQGKHILEIPESNLQLSNIQEFIDHAKNTYGIELRFRPE